VKVLLIVFRVNSNTVEGCIRKLDATTITDGRVFSNEVRKPPRCDVSGYALQTYLVRYPIRGRTHCTAWISFEKSTNHWMAI